MINKNSSTKLFFSQYGGEQPIPPEFIAAMNRQEEVQAVPNDVEPEGLSDTIVESKVTTDRTNERVRRTIKKVPGNIVLRAIHTDEKSQPVQVTRTLLPTAFATANPQVPTATANVADQDLGNGWTIREVGLEGTYVGDPPVFVESVFPSQVFERRSNNVIPLEFKVAIPDVIHKVESAGTAVDPTLSANELSEKQEQLTEFRKSITTVTQDFPTLPVVNDKSKDTNSEKQDVVVIKKLINDSDSVDVATATKDVKVEQLGDGRKVQETREVATIFPAPTHSRERPNLTPEKFRPTIPTIITQIDDVGTATDPVISGDTLSQTQEQVNTFKRRTKTATQATPTLPVILDKGKDTNQVKQDVVVIEKLINDGDAVDVATATKEVRVEQLGDGHKVQETREVSSVFPASSFSRERPNLTPEEFRPSIPTIVTQVDDVGTAADPVISGTQLAETQEQVNVFKRRTKTVTQDVPTLPVILDQGRDTNQARQDVVVTKTLLADGTTADVATALKEVQVKQLGDGRKVQVKSEVASLFPKQQYTVDRQDFRELPPKFRAKLPETENAVESIGTSVAAPTLNIADLMASARQVTEKTILTIRKSRDLTVLPITITDTKTDTQGHAVTVAQTLALTSAGLTTDSGLLVLESTVDNLGDGLSLKTTATISSWPLLSGVEIDSRHHIAIPYTEQIVDASTATGGVAGNVETTLKPIDQYKTEQIVRTLPTTAVLAYNRVLYGNTTNVDVPPQLELLYGVIDTDGGAGSYSENGYYTLSGSGGGSGNLQLRGSAQAAASALPELGHVVKIPRTNNIPCIHVLLYVANGSSRTTIVAAVNTILGSVTDWPNFRPQPITVLGLGGKVNIRVEVAVSAHDSVVTDFLGAPKFNGSSRTNGTGVSYDSARVTKTWNISPTIHSAVSLSGDTDVTTANYIARGTINSGVSGATSDTGNVYCNSRGRFVILSDTGATTGDASIPSSGKRVHRLVSEPDPVYDLTRVLAEVVDFGDITP